VTLGAIAGATMIGALLGVGVHLLVPGAGAAGNRAAVEVQVAGAQLDRSQLPTEVHEQQLGSSVLRVGSQGCGESRQATAIVVRVPGGEMVVLTNAHVVRGAGTLELTTQEGEVQADVAGAVTGRDAAVIRVPEGVTRSWSAMTVGPPAELGQPVVVAGYPGAEPQLLAGTVASIERRSGFGGSSDVLIIDAPAENGLSGGAVLDARGRVVGLVVARDPATRRVVAHPIESVIDGMVGAIPTC